jgi:hypothetical protein
VHAQPQSLVVLLGLKYNMELTQPQEVKARTIIGKNILIFLAYSIGTYVLTIMEGETILAFLYLSYPVHLLFLLVQAIRKYRLDNAREACLYIYTIFILLLGPLIFTYGAIFGFNILYLLFRF